MKNCKWHLCNKQTDTEFCGIKCKNKFHVKLKRKRLKEQAVIYKGGKCEHCGYSKCIGALEFHHKNPEEKDFAISKDGNTRSWEKVKNEIDKCLLLCSNCHKEEHFNIRSPVAQLVVAPHC